MSNTTKTRQRPPSLLDSKQYQSALKFNQIETNKLEKLTNSVETDQRRSTLLRNQDWVNTQKWLLDIKTTSGRADLEKYNKILTESTEESDESTPQYYFMYGMRIGERPQLLKNFLGRTAKSKKTNNSATKAKRLKKFNESTFQFNEDKGEDDKPDDEEEKLTYNQIIIDGEVVTQLPIGYTKECSRLSDTYSRCTSQEVKTERKRKPLYYTQKYKYAIPPPNMF